jgi:FkbM family methyltransferase
MHWKSHLNLFLRSNAKLFPPNHPFRRRLAESWDSFLDRKAASIEFEMQNETVKLNPAFRSFDTNYECLALKSFLERLRPSPNYVVWDLGAHIGIYSILAYLKLRGLGRVRAWEPSPGTFWLLNEHLKMNQATQNVTSINEGIWDCRRELGFITSESIFDGSEMDRVHRNPNSKVSVMADTLDHWVWRQNEVPDLIKMDIEGSEIAAFRGARLLLSGNHPVNVGKRPSILLSFHPQYFDVLAEDPAELQSLTTELRYRVYDLHQRPTQLEDYREYWLFPV